MRKKLQNEEILRRKTNTLIESQKSMENRVLEIRKKAEEAIAEKKELERMLDGKNKNI